MVEYLVHTLDDAKIEDFDKLWNFLTPYEQKNSLSSEELEPYYK